MTDNLTQAALTPHGLTMRYVAPPTDPLMLRNSANTMRWQIGVNIPIQWKDENNAIRHGFAFHLKAWGASESAAFNHWRSLQPRREVA